MDFFIYWDAPLKMRGEPPSGGLFYPAAQADRVKVRLKSNQSI